MAENSNHTGRESENGSGADRQSQSANAQQEQQSETSEQGRDGGSEGGMASGSAGGSSGNDFGAQGSSQEQSGTSDTSLSDRPSQQTSTGSQDSTSRVPEAAAVSSDRMAAIPATTCKKTSRPRPGRISPNRAAALSIRRATMNEAASAPPTARAISKAAAATADLQSMKAPRRI